MQVKKGEAVRGADITVSDGAGEGAATSHDVVAASAGAGSSEPSALSAPGAGAVPPAGSQLPSGAEPPAGKDASSAASSAESPAPGTKIPVSVLVLIHSADGQVLLLQRADRPDYWQSVTGSLDAVDEDPLLAAQRELQEETGFSPEDGHLWSLDIRNRYEIYAHWRHRYPPGVTHNIEHVFAFALPEVRTPRLAPREHLSFEWLPWPEAAARCFSPNNAGMLRELARREGWVSPYDGGNASGDGVPPAFGRAEARDDALEGARAASPESASAPGSVPERREGTAGRIKDAPDARDPGLDAVQGAPE